MANLLVVVKELTVEVKV